MTTQPRSRLGGHAAAAILGVHPHLSPLDVFLHEKGEPTPEMRWGQFVEPALLRHFADGHGVELHPYEHHVDDPKREWLHALPDADVVGENAIVSAKNVGFYYAAHWGEPGTDDAPEFAIIQEQTYMGVLGVARSYVVASIGGRVPHEYVIPFDGELFGIICEATERFWRDHVLTGKPPPPDGSERYDRYLRKRFPKSEQTLRPASATEHEIAFCLQALIRTHAQTEAAIGIAKQKLMESIGISPGIEGSFGKITWRTSKDREVTSWKAMAEHLRATFGLSEDQWGALLNTFTTKTPGNRPLLLPRDWSKETDND